MENYKAYFSSYVHLSALSVSGKAVEDIRDSPELLGLPKLVDVNIEFNLPQRELTEDRKDWDSITISDMRLNFTMFKSKRTQQNLYGERVENSTIYVFKNAFID